MDLPPGYRHETRQAAAPDSAPPREREARQPAPGAAEERKDWRRPENRRGSSRRGGRRRFRQDREGGGEASPETRPPEDATGASAADKPQNGHPGQAGARPRDAAGFGGDEHGQGGRRRRRRRGGGAWQERGQPREAEAGVAVEGDGQGAKQGQRPQPPRDAARQVEFRGMFVSEKGGFGVLRSEESQLMPTRQDVFVPPHLVQRHKLRDGSIVEGPARPGQGQHKLALQSVARVDGKDPGEVERLVPFKKLTSIDPDFHYAVGDVSGDVSMRIVDIICPVGRGTRGLIVAPPRSGKTILMRKFAAAIEKAYPDVILMVLLVDERPEEATEWRRSTGGQVFVSTNDESAKHHVQLAEAVWMRCQRLVELGHDVVLLLDSITRLARAYNNLEGGSGRTLSGGLDTRAMERPKGLFGSARNTETAGSLTILGTTLVETGSRLDQVVFEEFKGTGNSELVLSRKLADRRIFPAIDIERSGTRKEEKLIGARRLKQIHTLRRVLLKMNFIEAMELLITKLEDVEKTDDFLKRFEVDPDA